MLKSKGWIMSELNKIHILKTRLRSNEINFEVVMAVTKSVRMYTKLFSSSFSEFQIWKKKTLLLATHDL